MTARLHTEPRLRDPDGFYERLLAVYRDLPEDEAARLSAKLILLLANHIGDEAVLDEALALAGGAPGADAAAPDGTAPAKTAPAKTAPPRTAARDAGRE